MEETYIRYRLRVAEKNYATYKTKWRNLKEKIKKLEAEIEMLKQQIKCDHCTDVETKCDDCMGNN